MVENSSGMATSSKLLRKRSRTLYQITLLIIAVYILSGLATYFIYSGSQNRLLEKSKDKLIQMHVNTIYTNSSFAIDFVLKLGQDKLDGLSSQSLQEAAAQDKPAAGQEYLNKMLNIMIDANFSGLQAAMLVIPPSPSSPQALAIAASSPSYVPELSDSLLQGVGAGNPYFWMDEGYSEQTAAGRNLVITKEVDLNGSGLMAYFIALKPMDTEITAINHFFDEKKSKGSSNLALMIIISIAALSILTFIFISLLIRRRITRRIDELQQAANEVMSGDLDVKIAVRKGEEFEGLKRAFNAMVKNLKVILFIPMSGEDDQGMKELGKDQGVVEEPVAKARHGRKTSAESRPRRSRTLYYITAFLTVIFLVSGFVSFFIFNHQQNSLIDEGSNEMIRGISGYFSNASNFIRQSLTPIIAEKLAQGGIKDLSLEEQYALFQNKQISGYQQFYNDFDKDLVANGALGLDEAMVVLTGVGIPEGATVIVSNDEALIYNWTVPKYLVEAIRDNVPYLYFDKGIPELGLEGEHIIVIETFDYAGGLKPAYIGIKSMHAEVDEMRSFYNQEKKDIYLWLIPIITLSLIAFVLLTFMAVAFLLRRNITRPVEELSTAAEQVMQGNLDVEIVTREGEDLAELKHAFGEMVESLRKLIARSVEDA